MAARLLKDPSTAACRIFVGHLQTEEMSRNELEEHFSKYGTIVGSLLNRGFGFVQFDNEQDAQNAIKSENGAMFKGRRIDVKPATKGTGGPGVSSGLGGPGGFGNDSFNNTFGGGNQNFNSSFENDNQFNRSGPGGPSGSGGSGGSVGSGGPFNDQDDFNNRNDSFMSNKGGNGPPFGGPGNRGGPGNQNNNQNKGNGQRQRGSRAGKNRKNRDSSLNDRMGGGGMDDSFNDRISGLGDRMGGPGDRMGGPGDRMGGLGDRMGGPGDRMGGPGDRMGGPGDRMGGPGDRMGGPGDRMGGPGDRVGGPGDRMGGPGDRMSGPGDRMGGPGDRKGGPGDRMGGPGDRMGGPGGLGGMGDSGRDLGSGLGSSFRSGIGSGLGSSFGTLGSSLGSSLGGSLGSSFRDRSPLGRTGRLDDKPNPLANWELNKPPLGGGPGGPGGRGGFGGFNDRKSRFDDFKGPGGPGGPGGPVGPGGPMRDGPGFGPGVPNDYPSIAAEKNDCEIIVVNKMLTDYAESIESRLKKLGLTVDLLFPNEDVPLTRVLGNISGRGCLYAIVITPTNKDHRSLTLNILHGAQQEHRNMPVEDAISLIMRDFNNYKSGGRSVPVNVPAAHERHPDAIQVLLNMLADNLQLTVLQYEGVIKYLKMKREEQVQLELGEDLKNLSSTPLVSDPKQAELQSRILNILNSNKNAPSATSSMVEAAPSPVPPPAAVTSNTSGSSSVTSSAVTPSPLLNNPTVQKALDSLFQGNLLKNIGDQQQQSPANSGVPPPLFAAFSNMNRF